VFAVQVLKLLWHFFGPKGFYHRHEAEFNIGTELGHIRSKFPDKFHAPKSTKLNLLRLVFSLLFTLSETSRVEQ
jgi:hypothetical protein